MAKERWKGDVAGKIHHLDELVANGLSALAAYRALAEVLSGSEPLGPHTMARKGYTALRSALQRTYMNDGFNLIDKRRDMYSLCHTANDEDLRKSETTQSSMRFCIENERPFRLWRNNISAHRNIEKAPWQWARDANVTHGEVDAFFVNAQDAVVGLANDNAEQYQFDGELDCKKDFSDEFIGLCEAICFVMPQTERHFFVWASSTLHVSL
ncbi:hypothetical protein [uncultured Tateyamaria sp.]|uniref:hypothetical protein n=1 Tax=uncultured Tateyamaria sp. TaxID=455651 RepID=UPI002627325A|nr:hypothetical protein [uncultured Tateyamaria sp.]